MRPDRCLEGAGIQPDLLVNIILLIGRIVKRNFRLLRVSLWKSRWPLLGAQALPGGVLPAGAGGVRQPVAKLGGNWLRTLAVGTVDGPRSRYAVHSADSSVPRWLPAELPIAESW
jgi:hypothetical protein